MAYKTFLNGYPLPASELNTYLMGQVVATFANASERSAAITSPVEGQLTYLEDANAYYTYTGSAWTLLNTGDVAGKNKIINGDFTLSQRGATITSINADYTYTADRWYVTRGGTVDYAQRETGSYSPPAGFQFYGEYVNKSAGNPFMAVAQPIETRNAIGLAGQRITYSFYARAHANTAASKAFQAQVLWSASTDTKAGTGLGYTAVALAYGTSASDWTRYTVSADIPSTAKTITLSIINTSSLAVNDGIHITGVQLEVGSVATPFSRAAGTLQGELAACQRYAIKLAAEKAFSNFGFGMAQSTTSAVINISLPVTMRVAPTSITSSTVRLTDYASGFASPTLTLSPNFNSPQMAVVEAATTGLTQFRPYALSANNSTSGYVLLEAEL